MWRLATSRAHSSIKPIRFPRFVCACAIKRLTLVLCHRIGTFCCSFLRAGLFHLVAIGYSGMILGMEIEQFSQFRWTELGKRPWIDEQITRDCAKNIRKSQFIKQQNTTLQLDYVWLRSLPYSRNAHTYTHYVTRAIASACCGCHIFWTHCTVYRSCSWVQLEFASNWISISFSIIFPNVCHFDSRCQCDSKVKSLQWMWTLLSTICHCNASPWGPNQLFYWANQTQAHINDPLPFIFCVLSLSFHSIHH